MVAALSFYGAADLVGGGLFPIPAHQTLFDRDIGIDYSGAETATSNLKGLQVFIADPATAPSPVNPPYKLASGATITGTLWLQGCLADEQTR